MASWFFDEALPAWKSGFTDPASWPRPKDSATSSTKPADTAANDTVITSYGERQHWHREALMIRHALMSDMARLVALAEAGARQLAVGIHAVRRRARHPPHVALHDHARLHDAVL